MAVTKVCFVSILEIVRFSVYKKSFLFGLSQVSNYRVDMFVSIISKIVSLLGGRLLVSPLARWEVLSLCWLIF